jgi:hypothetical protein
MILAGEWVEANPGEAAKTQVEKGYLPNPSLLDLYTRCNESYNYAPSVDGGRIGLRNNMEDLKKIGMIRADFDIEKVIGSVYIEFKNLAKQVR